MRDSADAFGLASEGFFWTLRVRPFRTALALERRPIGLEELLLRLVSIVLPGTPATTFALSLCVDIGLLYC